MHSSFTLSCPHLFPYMLRFVHTYFYTIRNTELPCGENDQAEIFTATTINLRLENLWLVFKEACSNHLFPKTYAYAPVEKGSKAFTNSQKASRFKRITMTEMQQRTIQMWSWLLWNFIPLYVPGGEEGERLSVRQ